MAVTALAAVAALAVVAGSAGAAQSTTIYSNMPKPQPGNTPSKAFEATSTSEFGGLINAAAESESATRVAVGMSSWACQSGTWNAHTCSTSPHAKFEWPVTLHVYTVGAGNSVGIEVARLTQKFKMPYRPSSSPKCSNGGWGGHCFNGKLFTIGFNLKGVVLPRPAIVSVSYNTSHYGPNPAGCIGNCPYDSLNVALGDPAQSSGGASVGSQPLPDSAYLDSSWGGAYCTGSEGTGHFRLDPGCWTGYQPLIVVATN